MFNKIEGKLDLPQIDKEILDYWDKNDIFARSISERTKCKEFVFYEGPPGMNGLPHIGHATTRIFKDIVLRYASMKGFKVERRAGWDTHGLPVEGKAEKDLGLTSKSEILAFGVDKYIAKCKEIINTYENEWRVATRKIGYWVNFDTAYRTCDDNYIESEWWSLKEMFDKGYIYEGYRVAPYCPRCGTSLAQHEVAQGYKTVQERTVFVKFALKTQSNTYFVAWTTTPWTLPSNTALAVNPKESYVKVKVRDEYYILAKALVSKLWEEYQIVEEYIGQDLEFSEYEPIYSLNNDLLQNKKAYYVTCADYVTLTDGTGIVHIAPAFGQDDSEVGKKYDLPFVLLINEKGCFTEDLSDYAGMRNIEANKLIIKDLKERNIIVKEQTIEHEYPHCWRCKTPLINYARSGWFISMSKFRDQLVKNNDQVNWLPPTVKDGRMGNFLKNALDWNLSRDRFWGTPLNIWRCEECGHLHAVGSKAELRELSGYAGEIEMHKPFIDNISIKCPKCGKKATRVPQVIDCWYDSGAMPFAQLHYPFENQEKFKSQFPADFITEAQDQTRGWFYTLQAISTVLFDKTPYKTCLMCGLINDKNGQKMSKSLGNIVDPNKLIDENGADALRWYFATNSAPWISQSFDEEGVAEVVRKTISTLWNTYSFLVLYANIDDFKPINLDNCKLNLMDKWLLSQLNATILNVTEKMDKFNFTDSGRIITDFIDILSNWYVRRSRERFWVDGENEDKTSAFNTLYFTLLSVTKMIAPFMPFVAEKIYQNLASVLPNKKDSVHLEDFPVADAKYINHNLNAQMQEVIEIVALGRAGRNTANIKTRQPLSQCLVYSASKLDLSVELLEIIGADLNVKKVSLITNPEEYITFELKPQLKTLGAKYGKNLSIIREFLQNCKANEVVAKLKQGETVNVPCEVMEITLSEADVLIYPHSKPDFCAETDFGITVILDTMLTKELIDEGYAREFISKIQNLRKDSGFAVEDKIKIFIQENEKLQEILTPQFAMIMPIVLADSIEFVKNTRLTTEIEINDITALIAVERL